MIIFSKIRQKISSKIILLTVFAFLLILLANTIISYKELESTAIEEKIEKARNISRISIGMRSYANQMHDKKLFDEENNKKDIKNKMFYTIPMVIMMEVLKASDLTGLSFRFPKFEPRNKKNEPDDWEANFLKKTEQLYQKNMKEKGRNDKEDEIRFYYEVQPKAEIKALRYTNGGEQKAYQNNGKVLRYIKPFYLEKSCLKCHGDPAKSYELWGRTDGKDITDNKMEGWKEGEPHGAIELFMELDDTYSAVWENLLINTGLNASIMVPALILMVIFMRKILKPLAPVSLRLKEIANGNLLGDSLVTKSTDEMG